jgi:hypothetical protein
MNENNIESADKSYAESEIFDISDKNGLKQIRNLEEKTFNWEVGQDELDLLEGKIQNPLNLTIVLRDSEKTIVGYVVATPSSSAEAEISSEDILYVAAENKLYIDTLAISEKNRGSILQIKNLFLKLIEVAKSKSYTVISAHIPTDHIKLYERFSDVQILRTQLDWFGSGEDHYYIEIKI